MNGTYNRKSHPYVITDVKDGNIIVHQITTTPPKFIKTSSLHDVVNNRESYVKLEQVDKTYDGRKISYFDAYITNSKKITSSDYAKLIQKKNEYSKKENKKNTELLTVSLLMESRSLTLSPFYGF